MKRTMLPNARDIERAADAIAGVAYKTPLVESPGLSKLTGKEVFLKLECFQPIRVFKIRGAYNKISHLSERSVVAASSGNHGIAVAYSARLTGKKCTIVVPESAVQEKVEAIQDYGADVVKAGKLSEEREQKARAIANATGAAFIHPFDDSDVIAGQGTCGLEISEQLETFDAVVVPVGGGGLISGVSIALKSARGSVKVYGAEPAAAPKLSSALSQGRIVRVPHPASIADGLNPSALGRLAFEACTRFVDGAFTASEEEILNALKVMITTARVFAEPSGSIPLAPLISQAGRVSGKRVVLVVSGGNVSRPLLAKVISEPFS